MSTTIEIDETKPWATWTTPEVVEGNLSKLQVEPDESGNDLLFKLADSRLGRIDRFGMRELSKRVGFPVDFMDKLTVPTRAAVIQERLSQADSVDLTFAVEDDRVISMLAGWRGVASHAQIAQGAYNVLTRVYPEVEVVSSQVMWDNSMVTRFKLPHEEPVTRSVGDVIRMGIEVRHRYGADLSAQLYLERLVCLNGAITAEHAFAWTQRSLGQVAHQIMWLHAGIQGAISSYENYMERARMMANTHVGDNPQAQLIARARAMRLPRRLERQLLDAFSQEPGDTEWHMHNAITRLASHNPDLEPSMRARIQRAAGDWTREFDIVHARLPRPIAMSVGAEIISENE